MTVGVGAVPVGRGPDGMRGLFIIKVNIYNIETVSTIVTSTGYSTRYTILYSVLTILDRMNGPSCTAWRDPLDGDSPNSLSIEHQIPDRLFVTSYLLAARELD